MEYEKVLPNGKLEGDACLYCGRTFKKKISHTQKRPQFLLTLGSEQETLMDFQKQVNELITNMKEGKRNSWKNEIPKASLEHANVDTSRLERPPADFYPLALYKASFPWPISRGNKKKGHESVKVQGVAGVSVPPTEDKPWKLIHFTDDTLKKKKQLQDESDDEDAVDQKYTDLVEQRSKARELDFDDNDAATDACLSGIALLDEGEAASPSGTRRRGGRTQASLLRNRTAMPSPNPAGSPKPQPKPINNIPGPSESPHALKGRKPMDLLTMAGSLETELLDADEQSLFFGESAQAQLRSVSRWGTLWHQRSAPGNEEHVKLYKKFQSIGSYIRMYHDFITRGRSESAIAAFIDNYNKNDAFMRAEPEVRVSSRFIERTRLKLIACSAIGSEAFAKAVGVKEVMEKCGMEREDAENFQLEAIEEGATVLTTASHKTATAILRELKDLCQNLLAYKDGLQKNLAGEALVLSKLLADPEEVIAMKEEDIQVIVGARDGLASRSFTRDRH